MKISRVVVKSERSVMTSATGDVKSCVEIEASLSEEEGQNPEYVSRVIQALRDNADAAVDAHLQKRLYE